MTVFYYEYHGVWASADRRRHAKRSAQRVHDTIIRIDLLYKNRDASVDECLVPKKKKASVDGRDESLRARDGFPLGALLGVHRVELGVALLDDAPLGVLQVSLQHLRLGRARGGDGVRRPSAPGGL